MAGKYRASQGGRGGGGGHRRLNSIYLFICTVLSAILLFLVYFTLFLFHFTLSISLPLRIFGITQNTAIATYKTLPNVISHCT